MVCTCNVNWKFIIVIIFTIIIVFIIIIIIIIIFRWFFGNSGFHTYIT